MSDSLFYTQHRNDYMQELIITTTPLFAQGIQTLFKDTSEKNTRKEFLLREFQDTCKSISLWSQHVIEAEHQRFLCHYEAFDELLRAIFVINSKILTHNLPSNQEKISVTIPKPASFIHACYIKMARTFWKKPFLFLPTKNNDEYHKNLGEIERMIQQCIESTVRSMLPYKEVMRQMITSNSSNSLTSSTSPSSRSSQPSEGSSSKSYDSFDTDKLPPAAPPPTPTITPTPTPVTTPTETPPSTPTPPPPPTTPIPPPPSPIPPATPTAPPPSIYPALAPPTTPIPVPFVSQEPLEIAEPQAVVPELHEEPPIVTAELPVVGAELVVSAEEPMSRVGDTPRRASSMEIPSSSIPIDIKRVRSFNDWAEPTVSPPDDRWLEEWDKEDGMSSENDNDEDEEEEDEEEENDEDSEDGHGLVEHCGAYVSSIKQLDIDNKHMKMAC